MRDGLQGAGGLGLANAKKIIDLHQGDIQVMSGENNTGVGFVINLPLSEDKGGAR